MTPAKTPSARPRTRLGRALLAAPLLACLGLSACSSGSFSDLDAWIAQVKKKPARAMEPLPPAPEYDRFTYQAHHLVDPFASYAPPVSTDTQGPRPNANRPREPLEEYALDSLVMVGTMGDGLARVALVMDPSGLVHRIGVGRYLGQHDGRVVGVAEDRISLIELTPNGRGGWEETPASLVIKE